MQGGCIIPAHRIWSLHEIQKKYLALRRAVHELYFHDHLSKARIRRILKVSKQFVITWTRSPELDLTADARGWVKGKRRRWSTQTVRRVASIHRALERSARSFYSGATAIEQEWRRRYPGEPVPPLRTLGLMLSELGLSSPRRRTRPGKGAARYLCYPEHTVYETLGGRVLEADFIGKKFLTGSGNPLHFVAFAFKKAPKLRHYYRVPAETAQDFITCCEDFFQRFEKPDYMKVDNDPATIGSGSAKRTLSRVVLYLLSRKVTPIFAVPRKPFSQASIEGNNSVFARKFWHRRHFRGIKDLDRQLAWFNEASLAYTGYAVPRGHASSHPFVPRVFLIRQVQEHPETHAGYINVMNEDIRLPAPYIKYFVLAEWNLNTQRLAIHFEQDQKLRKIKEQQFTVNNASLKHLKQAV